MAHGAHSWRLRLGRGLGGSGPGRPAGLGPVATLPPSPSAPPGGEGQSRVASGRPEKLWVTWRAPEGASRRHHVWMGARSTPASRACDPHTPHAAERRPVHACSCPGSSPPARCLAPRPQPVGLGQEVEVGPQAPRLVLAWTPGGLDPSADSCREALTPPGCRPPAPPTSFHSEVCPGLHVRVQRSGLAPRPGSVRSGRGGPVHGRRPCPAPCSSRPLLQASGATRPRFRHSMSKPPCALQGPPSAIKPRTETGAALLLRRFPGNLTLPQREAPPSSPPTSFGSIRKQGAGDPGPGRGAGMLVAAYLQKECRSRVRASASPLGRLPGASAPADPGPRPMAAARVQSRWPSWSLPSGPGPVVGTAGSWKEWEGPALPPITTR